MVMLMSHLQFLHWHGHACMETMHAWHVVVALGLWLDAQAAWRRCLPAVHWHGIPWFSSQGAAKRACRRQWVWRR